MLFKCLRFFTDSWPLILWSHCTTSAIETEAYQTWQQAAPKLINSLQKLLNRKYKHKAEKETPAADKKILAAVLSQKTTKSTIAIVKYSEKFIKSS